MKTKKVTLEELKDGDEVLIVSNRNYSRNRPGDVGIVNKYAKDGFTVDVESKPEKVGDEWQNGNYTMIEDVELVIEECIICRALKWFANRIDAGMNKWFKS